MALLVYDTATNISSYVKEGSLSITEQLNSRRNTCNFSTLNRKIDQGKSVYVYETLKLRKPASSGQKVLEVEDTYQDCNKFASGDEVTVDIKGTEMTYEIDTVSHTNRTVTLTANLTSSLAVTQFVGRLLFGGIVIDNPDEELDQQERFEYKIKCVDWLNLFDRKNVIQQFENMYPREIIGRTAYFFTANDSQSALDNFEAAWTQGGNALAMSNETTDKIQGSRSQKTGTSSSGSCTWTKTITAQDIDDYRHARFWWKIASGNGGKITAMKLRLGQDSSNYFEYNISNIGPSFEDCWNYESVILSEYSSTNGSPTLTGVDWLQIVVTAAAAISAGDLLFDVMQVTTGGFTLQNVSRGDSKFIDVRCQHKRPSELMGELAKPLNYFWYIDVNRDIHFEPTTTSPAPFSITDSSENYSDLSINTDISHLVNRQMVLGGEAPSAVVYEQFAIADGVQTSFPLDYKPSELVMEIDDGGGFVEQSIGVEGFVDETTVDWIYNFNEKVIRATSVSPPAIGATVRFTYYPYEPIRVRVTSPASITAMQALTGGDGCYDGLPIKDPSIASFIDARKRGQAELNQWANPVRNATFDSEIDGLKAGQLLTITDSGRSISGETFLIQKISKSQKFGDRFNYNVQCTTTLFGIIEFLQMLLKRTEDLTIDPAELVDTLENVDETITFTDSVVGTAKSKTVYAALKKTKNYDFVLESGTKSSDGAIVASDGVSLAGPQSDWYAEFTGGETGTIQFASSNHNNAKELRITATTGGNGLEAKARLRQKIPAAASTLYTIEVWTEIQTALTNVGTGGGLQLVVKEYDSSGSLLATNTITSALTTAHDFTRRSATFTSNSSTAFIDIQVSVYRAAGTGRVADIIVTPATTETATLPGIASFSQAT